MKKDSITIPRWFDRHLHIRDGDMMKTVLPCTLKQRVTGAVIMPNLMKPGGVPDPVDSIKKAKAYRKRIMEVYRQHLDQYEGSHNYDSFVPCMTLYLTDEISPEEVVRGFEEGAWRAVKLYMANQQGQGGTTGSAHGVKNLLGRYQVFEAMQKHKIPLLGHFEAVEEDVDEFDREVISMDRDVFPLKNAFPELTLVLEHITDGRTADWVAETPDNYNVYATVTAHHLMINRNAMFWGGMNPVNYCKPVPKRELHRRKIRQYVTSGNPRFGAGTDSAPHDESAKMRCCGCAAGIFTGDSAVERYTTVFDEDNALEHVGSFLSENLLHVYGMEVSKETMTVERGELVISKKVGNVPVFQGGSTLPWKLVR